MPPRNFAGCKCLSPRICPAVEGDPTQIQQVLINLVRNAFDAMRDTPPSRRTVETDTAYNGDGAILVAVRDYGSGISEPTSERLFEQFFTTKKEGLGMGLAIARSIIEAHGGTVTAENADGGGARFYFRLPINREDVTMIGSTCDRIRDRRRSIGPKKSGAFVGRCPLQN